MRRSTIVALVILVSVACSSTADEPAATTEREVARSTTSVEPTSTTVATTSTSVGRPGAQATYDALVAAGLPVREPADLGSGLGATARVWALLGTESEIRVEQFATAADATAAAIPDPAGTSTYVQCQEVLVTLLVPTAEAAERDGWRDEVEATVDSIGQCK